MIKGLPEDAASMRHEGQQWTTEHELAAAHLEQMDRWGRNLYALMFQKFSGGKHAKLGDPLVIPRPGSDRGKAARRRRVMRPSEAAAFFNSRRG